MITQEAFDKSLQALKMADSTFSLVSNLVTRNECRPSEALQVVHGSAFHHDMWTMDLWMLPGEELYRRFCSVENIECHCESKEWDYPLVDFVEYAIGVFETYRFLTKNFVSGGALELLFMQNDLYRFLLKEYHERKIHSECRNALHLENEIRRRGAMEPQFELIEVYKETDLERFFRLGGSEIVRM